MKKTKELIAKFGKLLLVFGIVFSQLSFPLSVLADELAMDTTMAITDEVSETSEESNQIANQEEQNDNTNGETTEEQTTTNNQEEENNPNEETNTTNFTVEMIENEEQNLYIIKNEVNATLTVKQIKEENSIVTTEEGDEITDENEVIKSGYQITIIAEDLSSKTYTIIMLGDYNEDGMITIEDQEALLEIFKTTSKEEVEEDYLNQNMVLVDLNKDEKFDILDITYPIFTEETWENEHVATDELENYLMATNEEVYVEEEIEVNYFVEGFEIDSLVGIQGKINYDNQLLELTKIQVNGIEQDIEELTNNSFIYLLENYSQDGVLITLTFKALATGTPIISIEDIVASIGGTAAKLDVDKVTTTFNNLEYGKGGNEEDTNTTEPITPPTTETTSPVIVQTTSTPILLSSDNDIKSLIIEGYEIEFDSSIYEYSIKVKNDVTSLNLSVLLNSEKSIYYVEGNENFEVGENLVYVIVKAENGSAKTYTITVEKEQEVVEDKENKTDKEIEEEPEEEKNNTSKTVIIILIVLVIIGLIYVIFKDDEEDTKETEKNTKKASDKTNKKGSKK